MKKQRFRFTKMKTCVLCFTVLATSFTGGASHAYASSANVIAQWNFDEQGVKQGTIQNKDLIFKDLSGNGNDLEMNTYGNINPQDAISFTSDKMYDGTNGSIALSGNSAKKEGVDLLTVKDAPINKENFENGYTIEFVYKLPGDWTTAESWMSLMARQGDAKSMDEPELGTMNMAISNCKEIQFLTANKDDSHSMESASWSVSMDKGDVWYHIAVVSDNNVIRTFVNGVEAFRDYVSDEMQGMYADPSDGRFRIGSSWWKQGSQTIDKFARGNYQQVRISDGALDKANWLISNPEQFVGSYGSNENFTITNGGAYNMVFIPDTQNTIKFKDGVMDTAIDWVGSNMEKANIKAVMGLGDVVENWNSTTQWEKASRIFNKLPKANVPFLIQPGNHDYGDSYYLDAFGPNSDFMKYSGNRVINDSPSGFSSYMRYEAGSYQYMMISLSMNHVEDPQEVAWFKNVLEKNKNVATIVTSHDLQNCSDTTPNAIKLSPKGETVWNIVREYNQVFMMVGGHSHGAGHEILKNNDGNEVISLLADYQFAYNGGNALFKFAEFNEAKNKIAISTFSPYAYSLPEEAKTYFDVNYLTGPGNYTELDFNFNKRFANTAASAYASRQQVINTLVNNIDELASLDKMTLHDKEHVYALKKTYDTLHAKEQSNFNNADKLLAAYDRIVHYDGMLTQVKTLNSKLETASHKQLNEDLTMRLQTMKQQVEQAITNIMSMTLSDEAFTSLTSNLHTLIMDIEGFVLPNIDSNVQEENGAARPQNTEGKPTVSSVNTGDTTNFAYIMITLLGSAVFAGIMIRKRMKINAK